MMIEVTQMMQYILCSKVSCHLTRASNVKSHVQENNLCVTDNSRYRQQGWAGSSVGIATGYGLDGPGIESGFGGLVVSMLASGTQDRVFAPDRSRRIFPAGKIHSIQYDTIQTTIESSIPEQ
jgi:hypothetical protein